jgi:hypothetical protein
MTDYIFMTGMRYALSLYDNLSNKFNFHTTQLTCLLNYNRMNDCVSLRISLNEQSMTTIVNTISNYDNTVNCINPSDKCRFLSSHDCHMAVNGNTHVSVTFCLCVFVFFCRCDISFLCLCDISALCLCDISFLCLWHFGCFSVTCHITHLCDIAHTTMLCCSDTLFKIKVRKHFTPT